MAKARYAPGRYVPPARSRGGMSRKSYMMSAAITKETSIPWVGALGAIGAVIGLSSILQDTPSPTTAKIAGTAAVLFGGYVFAKDFGLL